MFHPNPFWMDKADDTIVWLNIYFVHASTPRLMGFSSAEEAFTCMMAFYRLHHEPGVNPHNNGKTAPIRAIYRARPEASRGFWWTSPDLHADEGVAFICYQDAEKLWSLESCECQACKTPKCPTCGKPYETPTRCWTCEKPDILINSISPVR